MTTQPYASPDLLSKDTKKDPGLEPVAEDTAKKLVEGAEQQVGGSEIEEASETDRDNPHTSKQGHAQQRGGQAQLDDEKLDEALDESFPASDPPSQTTKGRHA